MCIVSSTHQLLTVQVATGYLGEYASDSDLATFFTNLFPTGELSADELGRVV